MESTINRIDEFIVSGSKSLKGPKLAALFAGIINVLTRLGIMIVRLGSNSHGANCGFEQIRQFDVACLQLMWGERDDNHGWDTVFNILDCFAMLCIIWVFDGLRTINKDKDVGTLMVSCSSLAILINVITTLIESGLFNTAKFIGSWNVGDHYPDLEIAYNYASQSFNWLYNIDDCLMVIPYFWAYMLCIHNDKVPKSFSTISLVLALASFLFFLFSLFQLMNVFVGILYSAVVIVYTLLRFVWLFQAYVIFKHLEQ